MSHGSGGELVILAKNCPALCGLVLLRQGVRNEAVVRETRPQPLSLGGEKQACERGYADTIPIKHVKTGASCISPIGHENWPSILIYWSLWATSESTG